MCPHTANFYSTYFGIFFFTQALTFLRSNYKSKGHDGYWYVINIPGLKRHLSRQGRVLPPSFSSCLGKLYQGYFKSGVLQLFLKPGINTDYIQRGMEGRKSSNNVYVRAVMIQKETVSVDTCVILDKGNTYNTR